MAKTKAKMPMQFKINIAIFFALAVIFAILPSIIIRIAGARINSSSEKYSSGDFIYVLNDVCPCHTGDDDCSGYFACGPDKANITYNLDSAPEEKLEFSKQMSYLANAIEVNRQGPMTMRLYLWLDMCYILSFISLVAGIIYWIHCAGLRRN